MRVALDETRGRQTPEVVVRLAQLTMPPLPSPLDALRTPEGRLRADPAARREEARYVRRTIRAAQLRVALDEQRGRQTPESVRKAGSDGASITQVKANETAIETIDAPQRVRQYWLWPRFFGICTTKTLRMLKTPGFPGVFIGGDGGI